MVPPLAMAETMMRSCMGEVTTAPWPMLATTVLPADQPGWPRRRGCGLGSLPLGQDAPGLDLLPAIPLDA